MANGKERRGTAGDDELIGVDGNDTLHGLAGDDSLHGGTSRDHLYGGDGNDYLDGGTSSDTLIGGAGDDTLHGGTSSDIFVFRADHGHDTIRDFSENRDQISLDGVTDFDNQVTVEDAGKDATVVWAGGTITLLNVNHTLITANDFEFEETRDYTPPVHNDYDDGKDGPAKDIQPKDDGSEPETDNKTTEPAKTPDEDDTPTTDTTSRAETDIVVIGASGNDTLEGTLGRDILFGSDGNDILTGGAGVDYLIGGDGDDVFKFGPEYDSDYDVIADFTSGEDQISIEGVESFDKIKVESSTRNHSAYGEITVVEWNAGKLFLMGDFTTGLTESDFGLDDSESAEVSHSVKDVVVAGNSSSETLEGGSGDDTIDAGGGNDTLIGGAGDDILHGGGGDDVFVFNANHGNDIIKDFRINKDKIRLFGEDGNQITDLTVIRDMISAAGDDTRISWDGGEITLEDILYADVIANLDAVF